MKSLKKSMSTDYQNWTISTLVIVYNVLMECGHLLSLSIKLSLVYIYIYIYIYAYIILYITIIIAELSTNTTLNMLAKEKEGISSNESLRIENVTYKNYIIQQTMFNYLSNTNFLGISVSCLF